MATKYTCTFYSENVDASGNEQKWKIDIDSASFSGSSTEFKCTSEGFNLKMDGGSDSMLSPIKTTSVDFNMILESATLEGIIDDLQAVATGNEDDFSIAIYNYYSGAFRLYWVGYLLGDLVTLTDTSINRIINIKAVDGISRLKYKDFDHSSYYGSKSIINLIKICLAPLSLTKSYYNDTTGYIAHTPFYYNKGMLGGSTWGAVWRENVNNDPLALTKVDPIVFKDNNGKWWSYYKVLEQLLSTFQLRMYFTQMDYQITGIDTNPMWFLQSPLVNHGNNNNDNYDSTQLIFYHSKLLTTDVALSYDNAFNQSVSDVSDRAAGSLEMFMPPLLSYKSIYNHSIFKALALGPLEFTSTDAEDGTTNNYGLGEVNIDLTGIEDEAPVGWTDNANKISQQRIMITGNITTDIIDNVTANGLGYLSGKEYWDANYSQFASGSFYYAVDTGYHFPRMGLNVRTSAEAVESGGELIQNFWMGDARFSYLYGSVSWLGGAETNAYSSNIAGYNGTAAGLKYDIGATYPSTVFVDANNVALWGQDIGDLKYWYATDTGEEDPAFNPFAYFSPVYNQHNVGVVNTSSTWNGNLWGTQYSNGEFLNTTSFQIISPKIPMNRQSDTGAYGWNKINKIYVYLGFTRDRVVESDGTKHYVCCKDWTVNRELDCHNRGVHFLYSYSDVRAYVLGAWAGADSYDNTIAWWENGNGECSDEDTQSPEIIIGDEPQQMGAYASTSDTEGFGGEYLGQFRIFTAADATGSPVSGATTQDWRTIHQTDTEDNKLHIKRAKLALAHRYILKQRLDLNIIDRNTNFNLTRFGFSNILYWTSGEWYQNSASANLAFIPTGGTFTAGTGAWKLIVEDCVTYSKNNLTDKSFSSDG